MKTLLGCIILSLALYAQEINVTVFPESISKIDFRLFGHFLERPSWGNEFGIEDAVLPGTNTIDPRVMKKLKGLHIPVLRFPGGTDVDYTNWTDMIDLPDRAERPITIGNQGDTVTNRFGYDEFYELAKELESEAIIPINFFDAYLKRLPLEEAAQHQAGLVAYCNAEVGRKLPDGMKDWPAVRAQNGYKEPFKFKYFQIGNETWALWQWKSKMLEEMNFDDPYGWYIECATTYIEMIKAIDPDIEIMADFINKDLFDIMQAKLGHLIDYYVFHHYMPWGMDNDNVQKDGQSVLIKDLTDKDVWNAFVSTPCTFDEHGMALITHPLIDLAREHNKKIAVTEWNWNGWWAAPKTERPLESFYAHAVGAAGFLHGFMRNADVITMANQSMLVGSSWGITGIRVDKQGITPPHYHPTAQMTSFYADNHGDYLLASHMDNSPTYDQPFRLATIRPVDNVAVVDVVATGSEKKLSIFFINRDFDTDQLVNLDLSAFAGIKNKAQHVIITGVLNDADARPPEPYMSICRQKITTGDQTISVTLPKRSVSVVHVGIR